MIIKWYCRYKGIMCSLATEFGYCNLTACINRAAMNQEHKTGKWIESEQRDRTICSVCGYWQDLKAKFLFSFCPNCGSLMRGGYTNENISDS